jgi:hypothetical protein
MKWISRKLFVLLLGTVLLIYGKIDGNVWLILAAAYMGFNILDKFIDRQNQEIK